MGSSFPNPAEHCRAIGVSVGDSLIYGLFAASRLEVVAITKDSIAVLNVDGELVAMGPDRNITARQKYVPKPEPLYVMERPENPDDRVRSLCRNGFQFAYIVAKHESDIADIERVVAAGLAVLNAPEPVEEKAVEGPYRIKTFADEPNELCGFEITSFRHPGSCLLHDEAGDPLPGLTVDESNRLIGEALQGMIDKLNRLHAAKGATA